MAAINYDEARYSTEELITYKEFMSAIKGQDRLCERILPRTLSFLEVLSVDPQENKYEISDMQIDDFYMFRYELHTIFKQHQFRDE